LECQPLGAKARIFLGLNGTAEAVPAKALFMKPVLLLLYYAEEIRGPNSAIRVL
jgi:hypothetical protein